jgi:hypothetical protein
MASMSTEKIQAMLQGGQAAYDSAGYLWAINPATGQAEQLRRGFLNDMTNESGPTAEYYFSSDPNMSEDARLRTHQLGSSAKDKKDFAQGAALTKAGLLTIAGAGIMGAAGGATAAGEGAAAGAGAAEGAAAGGTAAAGSGAAGGALMPAAVAETPAALGAMGMTQTAPGVWMGAGATGYGAAGGAGGVLSSGGSSVPAGPGAVDLTMASGGEVGAAGAAESGAPYFGGAETTTAAGGLGSGGAALAGGGLVGAQALSAAGGASGGGGGGGASGGAASAGLGAAGSMFGGLVDDSEWLKILARGVPGLLGAFGAASQAEDYEDLANQYMNMGAPYRSRLEQLYGNPQSFLNSPEVRVPIQQGTDMLARSLSVKGNPAGSGNALQELQNYASNQLFGRLGEEKNRLANYGGLSRFAEAAPGAATGAIGAQKGVYDALGAGAADIFNPPRRYTLQDLMSLGR